MDIALWIEWLIKSIVLILVLLTGFAYMTYMERKFLGRFQNRYGPNRAGPLGLLQPIADAVKLIFKEELIPAKADKLIFILAPILCRPCLGAPGGGAVWRHRDHIRAGGQPVGRRKRKYRHPLPHCDHFHQYLWHGAGGLVIQ